MNDPIIPSDPEGFAVGWLLVCMFVLFAALYYLA